MKKVVILVNKDFEYEGFRRGIASVYAKVEEFAHAINLCEGLIDSRRPIYEPPLARYVFENLEVEVYCIQYLFRKNENSSNSQEKYEKLTKLFATFATKPDYVISVSTSESTPDSQTLFGNGDTVNGCVFVGNQFYLSDQRDPEPKSKLVVKTPFYADNPLHEKLYGKINALTSDILDFRKPESFPASQLKCFAGVDFVGIDVVNVMDYNRYKEADQKAYEEFQNFFPEDTKILHKPIGIETTHGVVKMAVADALSSETPVMLVSPITDRYLKFDEDVKEPWGQQNISCSYNGGVATGHILTILNKLLGTDK